MDGGAGVFLVLMIFAPAAMGLAAVVGAVLLLRPPKDPAARRDIKNVIAAAVLLVFALGVGACYGMMFLSR